MIILYIIFAIIAVLAAVLLINTALQTRNAKKPESLHPTFTDGQLGSIHAADENLDISAVAEATAFYRYFVENYR